MKRPLPGSGPIKRWFHGVEDGRLRISTEQDVTPIIEANKKMANHNGRGRGELRHIAKIPFNVLYMWGQQDGVALHLLKREEKMAYLRRKLSDPDWRFLRTSSGRL